MQFIDVEDAAVIPPELSQLTRYYIVNPTANTFQVSATRGASPITFTGGTDLPVTVYVWPMVPGGLQPYLEYFVVNATADTFRLSATPGGTPITITDAPASRCKVGVVYAGIVLESAGKTCTRLASVIARLTAGRTTPTGTRGRAFAPLPLHQVEALSAPPLSAAKAQT